MNHQNLVFLTCLLGLSCTSVQCGQVKHLSSLIMLVKVVSLMFLQKLQELAEIFDTS